MQCIEFCHLKRNASKIRQKVGNGVSYTRFPLPTLLCAGYSVKLIFLMQCNFCQLPTVGRWGQKTQLNLIIPLISCYIKH